MVVGGVEGNVGTNRTGGETVGVGETKSLGTKLGTNDSSSLGTVDGATDRLSLGIVEGTNDVLGTRVELGVNESASASTVTGDGASDINGDTALRSLLLPVVELSLRLSEMASDKPTSAPTSSIAKTTNPMGSRITMVK